MTDRWVSDTHWRRQSRQSRSERTQTALLDAAGALIVERGIDGTSIADIAARAGCSVGTVYHHFKDKTALCHALFQRMTDAYADSIRQASDPALWTDATIPDLLRSYITMMLGSGETPVFKQAAQLVMADAPDLRAHLAELQGEGRRALLRLVLDRRDQIGHPDPDRAAAFLIDQIGAMLNARKDPAQRLAALTPQDDASFTTDVLALADSYLRLHGTG